MNTKEFSVMSEFEILSAALNVGFVKFSYFKKDGSHRVAIGTRNKALIDILLGERKEQSGRNTNRPDYCETYFDLCRGDFRCFIRDNFDRIELERMDYEQAAMQAVAVARILDGVSELAINAVTIMCGRLIGDIAMRDIDNALENAISEFEPETSDKGDCFQSVMQSLEIEFFGKPCGVPTAAPSAPRKTEKERLIEELLRLQKRENEILALLF